MSHVQGLMVGIVKSVDDPKGQGRIQVDLPSLPGRNRTNWAPVASMMAGNGRGGWFMPELEDEVVVAFLGADPEQPVIVGFRDEAGLDPIWETRRIERIRVGDGWVERDTSEDE